MTWCCITFWQCKHGWIEAEKIVKYPGWESLFHVFEDQFYSLFFCAQKIFLEDTVFVFHKRHESTLSLEATYYILVYILSETASLFVSPSAPVPDTSDPSVWYLNGIIQYKDLCTKIPSLAKCSIFVYSYVNSSFCFITEEYQIVWIY